MTKLKTYHHRQIHRSILALIVCASSLSVHAAIITDSSERRIEVRQGSGDTSNAYISPSNNVSSQRPGVTMLSGANASNGDSMQSLIAQKQRDFEIDASLSIEENQRVNVNQRRPTYNTTYRNNSYSTANNTYNRAYNDFTSMDFNAWLNSNSYRAQQVAEYQRYLSSRVGAQNVPPLSQLLTTARSWDKCGYEPYQLPPRELWANIVPTLHLYSELKNQGILPLSTEIRSVYRSPGLNECAGGADSSKHMNASAMDIWVPEYEDNLWRLSTMQDGLCQFWQYQGKPYNFGLGLYATGAIHLDTDGYRKWGFNHASSSSSCRY
ncbi:MAG: D-Ala-D-Ala carboxypeptidase family metallohydrolase [Psychrobacter sp.]|uniref:D-Ala-D-Ala carboxypeptidase family metallohydrolase n=1 Tax=Psychrobacter sp. TaxID=56811 RepID=UPI002649688D|nr:D-Ala-D-Ala carboxypeptidase family metallohydrolase [Psychrobacter sp.]MDN5620975.1 D-Ala-D-Ala carboxypeptidase family metallohydrolase [Psychrobacter sp.]